jgi:hypothetical protein
MAAFLCKGFLQQLLRMLTAGRICVYSATWRQMGRTDRKGGAWIISGNFPESKNDGKRNP